MNSSNYKIGLYVRNSDPKQDTPEGTVKNQEERLRQYVELRNMSGSFGEIVQIYTDRSISAKNMNRPAVQNLLRDVIKGRIDMIMVSELSRITRNMKDFAEVWELLKEHKCGFLCLRENVDTSNAAGEMVMFMLANIAQFERKQTSERVAASHKIRASRGLYNGGVVPLGYRTIPDKKGFLEIDPERAKTVKKAFDYFLKYETLNKTARRLNEDGVRINRLVQGGGRWQRLEFFTFDNLHHILSNKAYKGVRVYKDGEKECEARAVWRAIIPAAKFDRVQGILKGNRSKKKPFTPQRYPYILPGLTFCAQCGEVMCGKSAHGRGRKYGYYEHSWAMKKGSTFVAEILKCNPHRVPARKLEAAVLGSIHQLVENPDFVREMIAEATKICLEDGNNREIRRLQSAIAGYNSNLEALTERVGELPKGVSAATFYRQMEKLEATKQEALERLRELESNRGIRGLPADFKDYTAFLGLAARALGEFSDPEAKAKIVRRLIHKVEIGVDEVKIHYYTGKDEISGEVSASPDIFLENDGSSSLTSGAQNWIL